MSDYSDYDNFGERQSQPPDVWIEIEARVRSDRAELLDGLDIWLQLGLISQAQVKKIARHQLCCPLPVEDFLSPQSQDTIPSTAALIPAVPATPNLLQRVWQSFLDELSIRWLLFLGIFLVVVSSGVLAASQWQNFPDYGQYLILPSASLPANYPHPG